jgi:hypothetical protein
LIFGLVFWGRNAIARGRFWQPGGLLEALTQWDSAYYIHIARYGYFHTSETWGTAGFFPFFPLLTRAMSFLFHDFRIAGVVTANICFLAAAILLHRLVRIDFPDRRVADATVTFLMFSPVSFFFSMAYTEATFLLLAVAAFLAVRRNRWLLAGICGMCLAATRNVGVWMAVPLFIEHVRQAWQADKRGITALLRPRLFAIALVPLGLGLYMLWGYVKAGDALAFAHAGAHWGRVLTSPLRTVATVATLEPFYRWLFLGSLVAAALLWGAGVMLRIRASYLAWAALLLMTYLCSNSLEAIPRYLSVVFPLFIVIGVFVSRYPIAREPLFAACVALLTTCTLLLANGYWMT